MLDPSQVERTSISQRCSVLGAWLLACTSNSSRLEEIARAQELEPARPSLEPQGVDLPPAPELTRPLPVVAPAPVGIDAALWRDIGWFPADAIDVSGMVGHQEQFLARWFEARIATEFAACAPLAASVERTYMVLQDGRKLPATVIFGTMTREQERACMRVALPALGLSGVQHDDVTLLSRAQELVVRVGWFRRPDGGAVLVLEGDGPLEGWARGGPLGPEIAALLGETDRSLGVWSAGLRDAGSVLAGVPSSGYTLALALPTARAGSGFSARLALRFTSASAVAPAEAGLRSFLATAPALPGGGLSLSTRADGTWLRLEVTGDLRGLEGENFAAWGAGVVQQLQARAERVRPPAPAGKE